MVISNPLSRIAKLLLKGFNGHLDTYIHPPESNANGLYIVVIEWIHESGRLIKSSANSKTEMDAFIKALVELGEVSIVRSENLEDRNGLAGGLFKSLTIDRAKTELIERDAFLYHYRNTVPFLSKKVVSINSDNTEIVIFEMMSRDPKFHCYLATDTKCAIGTSDCLLVGLGAHESQQDAIDKAIGEYFIMHRDHKMRPGWCQKVEENRKLAERLPDFHHSFSRDKRNIEIFKTLCDLPNKNTSPAIRQPFNRNLWCVRKISSPIKLFAYYLVDHIELMPLKFGQPEPNGGLLDPLYHPIW